MRWIREAGHSLPDAPEAEEIPEVTELDVACFPKGIANLCVQQASQAVDMDCCQPQASRHFGMGDWRPQCTDVQGAVADCPMLAMLLLRDGWVESVPNVH